MTLGVEDLAVPFARRALRLAPPQSRGSIASDLLVCLHRTRRFEEALRVARQMLEWSETPISQASAYSHLTTVAQDMGMRAEALGYADRVLALVREALEGEGPLEQGWVDLMDAALDVKASRLEEAGRLKEAREVDSATHKLVTTGHLGRLLREGLWLMSEGRGEEAELALRKAVEAATHMAAPMRLLEIRSAHERPLELLAELLERKGTPEAVEEARGLRETLEGRRGREEELRKAALEELRALAAGEHGGWRRSKKRGTGGRKGKKGKRKEVVGAGDRKSVV